MGEDDKDVIFSGDDVDDEEENQEDNSDVLFGGDEEEDRPTCDNCGEKKEEAPEEIPPDYICQTKGCSGDREVDEDEFDDSHEMPYCPECRAYTVADDDNTCPHGHDLSQKDLSGLTPEQEENTSSEEDTDEAESRTDEDTEGRPEDSGETSEDDNTTEEDGGDSGGDDMSDDKPDQEPDTEDDDGPFKEYDTPAAPIKLVVWRNEGENGPSYSFQLRKYYTRDDGDSWEETPDLFLREVPHAIMLLGRAYKDLITAE